LSYPRLKSMARRADVVALGLLMVSVFLFYWKLWLRPSHILFSGFSDLIVMLAGWQELLRKTWLEHSEVALWDPHIFCGIPFIGMPGCWAFYPLNWLFVLLTANLWSTGIVLSHTALGAVGIFLFLRRGLKLSTWPCAVGTLAYLYCGKTVIHVLVPAHIGFLPLAWIPWAMLSVDWLVDKNSWPAAAGLGAVLGVLGLSLYTQFCLYSALLLTFYFCFRIWTTTGLCKSRILKFVVAAALAGLLSSVQLIPSAEMAEYSARKAIFNIEMASVGSIGFQAVLRFLRPSAGSIASWQGDTFGWESAYHLGLLPLLVIPFAFSDAARRKEVICFLILSVVAAIHALGRNTPLFSFLFQWVPGFQYFRVPARSLFILEFTVPVLLALGLEAFKFPVAAKQLGVGGGCALLAVVAAFVFGDPSWLADAGGWILVSGLLYMASFGLVVMPNAKIIAFKVSLIICLLLETWSLFHLKHSEDQLSLFQTRPFKEVFDFSTIGRLGLAPRFSTSERVAEYNREVFHALLPEYLLVHHGGYDINGFNPLVTHRYVQFMSRVTGNPAKPEVWIPELKPHLNDHFLDLMNLRTRFEEKSSGEERPEISIRETASSMPRAWVVPQRQVVFGPDEVLNQLEKIDYRKVVLVEEDAPKASGDSKYQELNYSSYSPNSIRLSVELDASGYVVLSEAYHPGWKCSDYLNGASVPVTRPVKRANYLFRAIYLEAGDHELVLRFMPDSYQIGRSLSLLGLLIVAGLLLGPILSKRNKNDDSSA